MCLEEHYTLPDGRTIKVGAERFMAPEALFTPSLVNLEGSGLAEMVFDAIQVCGWGGYVMCCVAMNVVLQ